MAEDFQINYLAEIKEFHQQFVQPYRGIPKGSSNRQISELEQHFGFEFPLAYKQYLAFMGSDYNGVFVGCDWFTNNVVENTGIVPEVLAENNISFKLPENYLCFFSHQGYMMAWFELPKLNDNPSVWFYTEATKMKEPTIEGTFTEVLFNDMCILASVLPKLHRAT